MAGSDPGLADSFRVWGYDTCWGSFAQFCKVQAHQCLPKADHLTWEEAAAPTLTGATAYRMLFGWPPQRRRAGRRRAGVGRLGRAGLAGDPARGERRRPRGRRRELATRRPSTRRRSARSGTSTARTSRTGACRRRGTRPSGRTGSTARRRSARRSGTCWARSTSPRIVFEHPGAGHHPHVDLRLRPRRHDRDLRGDVGLRHHGRRALPLVHAEALPGLAPVQRRAGRRPSTSSSSTARSPRRSATTYAYDEAGTSTSSWATASCPRATSPCLVQAGTSGLKGL